MRLPDESISFQNTTGDSGVENLYVYGKLNYNFDNDDIKVKSINVTENSVFTGDISLDEITCRNANVTGIATVGTGLYVNGELYDEDGDNGSSGQILSSTGSGINWIDANTTSVANSINVGTNLNSTDADQFVTFVGSNSGNNPIRVDTDLKYNPSTNRLTAGSFAGDGSALTGVESFVTGMIIAWYGASNAIPTGFVLCDGNNNTPDLRDRFIIGAGNNYNVGVTGGSKDAVLVSHFHTTLNYVARSNYAEPRNFGVGTDGNLNNTGDTDTKGESGTDKNLPPYHALCYIMKT
jgi:hypothetical protein